VCYADLTKEEMVNWKDQLQSQLVEENHKNKNIDHETKGKPGWNNLETINAAYAAAVNSQICRQMIEFHMR